MVWFLMRRFRASQMDFRKGFDLPGFFSESQICVRLSMLRFGCVHRRFGTIESDRPLPHLQRFKSHRRINSFHFEPDVASHEVALLSLDVFSEDRLAAQDLLTD